MLKHINISSVLVLFAFLFVSINSNAQRVIDNITIGAEARTNGFGFASSADIKSNNTFFDHQIALNVGTLRHNRETKITNRLYSNPKPYIYGKMNNVFAINPTYGLNRSIGVASANMPSVHVGIEAGPSIAISRPYYVYVDLQNIGEFKPEKVAYDPNGGYSQRNILSGAGWNNGFSSMSANVGFSINLVLRTEWKQNYYTQRVKSVLNLTFYPEDLNILHQSDNQLFASFGMSYQVGSQR